MKCLRLTPACNISDEEIRLRELTRVIAALGRRALPRVSAHVLPHSHATANLARRFAATCRCAGGNNLPTLGELVAGAYLHDVGKYFISASVLLKAGELDAEERAVISLHPTFGACALSKLPQVTDMIRLTVLHHHEHWDGSGYPDGLVGTSIPLAARLVSVVDVYTSLRSRRSYKPTLTKREAFDTLKGMAGRELDPCLVEDFLRFAYVGDQE